MEREFSRSSTFFISISSALVALVVQLFIYEVGISIPLSPVFRSTGFNTRLISEFTPICLSIILLIWIKKEKFDKNKEKKVSMLFVILTLLCSVLATIILLRAEDAYAMITHPYALGPTIPSWVWTRVIFYSLLSLQLLVISVLFYGKRGLWILLPTSIIPVFYVFNNDMVVNATKIPSLAFLHPIYSFILNFGKLETLIVGGVLDLFGVKSIVNTNSFPYSIIMGGSMYLVDLPCIGWEGIVGYTIIFMNFMVEIVTENRMRILWAILGFFGTMAVNLIRLVIIFAFGAVWGASIANIIHGHVGDIIFLVWILGFLYLIHWFLKKKQKPPSTELKHSASIQLETRD
jgi:exosortase/archaeosortase family protein